MAKPASLQALESASASFSFLPRKPAKLSALGKAAATCNACPLFKRDANGFWTRPFKRKN